MFSSSPADVPEQADSEMNSYTQLPRLDNAPLPALSTFLPPGGPDPEFGALHPGPVSLPKRSSPRSLRRWRRSTWVPKPSSANTERPRADLRLLIFDYPTPSMAREQAQEFTKIPGAVVKRTGPLVAVIIQPPDPDAAERMLAKIKYQANVTLNEKVPVRSRPRGWQDDSQHLRAGRDRCSHEYCRAEWASEASGLCPRRRWWKAGTMDDDPFNYCGKLGDK